MFKLSGPVILDITGKASAMRTDMIFDFESNQKISLTDLGNSMDVIRIFSFKSKSLMIKFSIGTFFVIFVSNKL